MHTKAHAFNKILLVLNMPRYPNFVLLLQTNMATHLHLTQVRDV